MDAPLQAAAAEQQQEDVSMEVDSSEMPPPPPSPPPLRPPPPTRRRSARGANAAAAAAQPASQTDNASPATGAESSIDADGDLAAAATATPTAVVTAAEVTAEMTSFTQELVTEQSQEDGEAEAAVSTATVITTTTTTTTTVEVTATKKRTRKAKAPPAYDAGDYSPQALASRKFVGAHVSAAGGPQYAVYNASAMGARAFAMDTRSKRKWNSPPLKEEDAAAFRDALKQFHYSPDHVLPHGSYLMNLGSPNAEVAEKSRACLLAELERCAALGLHLYNFHPGSTCGLISKEECMSSIARALNEAHAKTRHLNGGRGVVTVLECMAGQGGVVGCSFEELKYIIDRVEDKKLVGVCIDTCHAFAAGIDLRTAENVTTMLRDFDSVIGLSFLRGLHFNDSKGGLNCRRDRHENIGQGCIGTEGFRALMNSSALDGLPIILETPCGDPKQARAKYANEIAALYQLEPQALPETRPGRPLPYHQPDAEEVEEAKQLKKEKAAQRKRNKAQRDEDEEGEEDEEAEEEAGEEDEEKASRNKKAPRNNLKRSASASAAVVTAAASKENDDDAKKPPLKRHRSAKVRGQ